MRRRGHRITLSDSPPSERGQSALKRVTVESLDRFRANLQSLVAEKAKTLPGLRRCDIRAEERTNGAEKY